MSSARTGQPGRERGAAARLRARISPDSSPSSAGKSHLLGTSLHQHPPSPLCRVVNVRTLLDTTYFYAAVRVRAVRGRARPKRSRR